MNYALDVEINNYIVDENETEYFFRVFFLNFHLLLFFTLINNTLFTKMTIDNEIPAELIILQNFIKNNLQYINQREKNFLPKVFLEPVIKKIHDQYCCILNSIPILYDETEKGPKITIPKWDSPFNSVVLLDDLWFRCLVQLKVYGYDVSDKGPFIAKIKETKRSVYVGFGHVNGSIWLIYCPDKVSVNLTKAEDEYKIEYQNIPPIIEAKTVIELNVQKGDVIMAVRTKGFFHEGETYTVKCTDDYGDVTFENGRRVPLEVRAFAFTEETLKKKREQKRSIEELPVSPEEREKIIQEITQRISDKLSKIEDQRKDFEVQEARERCLLEKAKSLDEKEKTIEEKQKIYDTIQKSSINNDNVNKEGECIVCMENTADHVITACGHVALCNQCGKELKSCPVCRKDYSPEQFIKIYRAN